MIKFYFRIITGILLLAAFTLPAAAQQLFKFAEVTDIHIGSENSEEDLQRTVEDINSQPDLAFVLVSGDITEFGADTELRLAKSILDGLKKPWYIVPGNHDTKWSESGGNTFRKVFGSETFAFKYGGYQFIGTNCGPNMRMGPGQVPRENIVWLDKVLKKADRATPIIYINHYPQNADLNNWHEAIDRLKQFNIQLIICGHGHTNRQYDFDGIPGVMCRSNLRAKDSIGGYNIVTVSNGKATFEERTPLVQKNRQWAEVSLLQPKQGEYARPSFAVNDSFPHVKAAWVYQDNSDMGSGIARFADLAITTNTAGEVYALQLKDGKRKWTFRTKGKIYATPAVEGERVVVASSDGNIYCLNAGSGKKIWTFKTEKPIVASTTIVDGIAYTGSSDGHFRAINVQTGKLEWDFDQVKGFVEDKPLYYQGNIYFGSWGNDFYALNAKSGELKWKWNNGASNRMFSPAACWPVAANGRVFIVAPDRYMTAFDAATGKVVWRKTIPDTRVRESIGLSADGADVLVKTMEGRLYGVSSTADSMQFNWQAGIEMGYELDPAPAVDYEGVIYIPTHSGVVYAIDRNTHSLIWKYKLSNCLVNTVLPIGGKQVLFSTMDGKLVLIKF